MNNCHLQVQGQAIPPCLQLSVRSITCVIKSLFMINLIWISTGIPQLCDLQAEYVIRDVLLHKNVLDTFHWYITHPGLKKDLQHFAP